MRVRVCVCVCGPSVHHLTRDSMTSGLSERCWATGSGVNFICCSVALGVVRKIGCA